MTVDLRPRPSKLPLRLAAAALALAPAPVVWAQAFSSSAPAHALSSSSNANLPDAPSTVAEATGQIATPAQSLSAEPAQPQPNPAAAGTLYGDVVDNHNALVPQAKIKATHLTASAAGAPLAPPVETTADAAGHFELRSLAPGVWKVEVSSPGFSNFVAPHVVVRPGLRFELQGVVLSIAEAHADVTVTMTIEQVAEQEIHDQEHQRVLAVFPNYNTSYVWNAAPMTVSQKFRLSAHSTLDPIAFFTAGIIAGGQQIRNTYPEFGGGPEGYAKRYGAAWTTTFIGHNLGYAVLPSVFHQDPRYFYMGTGTVKQRAIHAMLSSVLCRGNNGRTQFNASHVLGNFIAGIISKAYYPKTNSYGTLAVNNMILGTLGTSGVNLFREFALRRFSTGTPRFGNGKPEGEQTSAKHP